MVPCLGGKSIRRNRDALEVSEIKFFFSASFSWLNALRKGLSQTDQ